MMIAAGMTGALAAGRAFAAPLVASWLSVPPGDYDPASGHGPEWGKAAPAGLLIWLFMGVALFFLIKSMNKHLRRVQKNFGTDADAGGGTDGTDSAEAVEDDGAERENTDDEAHTAAGQTGATESPDR